MRRGKLKVNCDKGNNLERGWKRLPERDWGRLSERGWERQSERDWERLSSVNRKVHVNFTRLKNSATQGLNVHAADGKIQHRYTKSQFK